MNIEIDWQLADANGKAESCEGFGTGSNDEQVQAREFILCQFWEIQMRAK